MNLVDHKFLFKSSPGKTNLSHAIANDREARSVRNCSSHKDPKIFNSSEFSSRNRQRWEGEEKECGQLALPKVQRDDEPGWIAFVIKQK